MAKFLKHLGLGSKKVPPTPPKPDYSSEYTTPIPCTGCVNGQQIDCGPVSNSLPSKENITNVNCTKHSCPVKSGDNLKPPIVDEYSVPIDLKTTEGPSSRVSNEDDYTEPYQALKLLQKRKEESGRRCLDNAYEDTLVGPNVQKLPAPLGPLPSPLNDFRPKQDYDEPWDDKKQAFQTEINKHEDDHGYTHLRFNRNSNQPKIVQPEAITTYDPPWDLSAKQTELEGKLRKAQDNRNKDDYDKPWDAKRLSDIASEKLDDSRPIEEYDRPWNNEALLTRLSLGFECNTSLPLDQQKWYHGAISRSVAETRLDNKREGSFLIRRSESDINDHSLSVKRTNGYMHMKIVIRDNKYILGQFSQPFQNIPQMVQHYSLNKLPIRGAEHMSLLYPVNKS